MLRRAAAAGAAVSVLLSRSAATFSRQLSTGNVMQPFSQLPPKRRSIAIQESQKALTEYLNITRSLPYLYADYIATNSPRSLSQIVSKIRLSPSTSLAHSFQRFLRYRPINELDFFLESIGLSGEENELPPSILPPNTFFLSDWKHFKVACALENLGFPWSKLGLLFEEDYLILDIDPSELVRKVREIKDGYGFSSVCLIGICLAFPQVLYDKKDGLLSDLKVLLLEHDLVSYVDDNVDGVFEVCEKVRIFYDSSCETGKIGDLMGRSKSIFVEYSREVLTSKIDYFCKLKVRKDQVGLFLLSRPEIFGYEMECRVISVSGFLRQLGLSEIELKSLEQKYPHVFGRNRIANLPYVIRSMDLDEWFFERLQNGGHTLLGTYTISCQDEDLDKNYTESLIKIQTQKTKAYSFKRLDFLHGIGFGENMFAIKALAQLKGRAIELQQRFDCLLRWGIEYPKLCAMVRFRAKILNQKQHVLDKKLEFLCTEMGLSLQFLDVFPGYLTYNLEKRIKPRYRLHKRLVELGLCKKEYTISTMIAPSEKAFVNRISRIHPPSAEKWLEGSLKKDGRASFQRETTS